MTVRAADTAIVNWVLFLWPVWLILAGVGVLRLAVEIRKLMRLWLSGMLEIDQMDGTTFERRLAVLYRALGFSAEVIGSAAGDFGGDLIVTKDGKRCVVQAKCWQMDVGVHAVQEVLGARCYYAADSAVVVTNRYFTKPAQALAGTTDVELWSRDELTKALLQTAERPRRDRVGLVAGETGSRFTF